MQVRRRPDGIGYGLLRKAADRGIERRIVAVQLHPVGAREETVAVAKELRLGVRQLLDAQLIEPFPARLEAHHRAERQREAVDVLELGELSLRRRQREMKELAVVVAPGLVLAPRVRQRSAVGARALLELALFVQAQVDGGDSLSALGVVLLAVKRLELFAGRVGLTELEVAPCMQQPAV